MEVKFSKKEIDYLKCTLFEENMNLELILIEDKSIELSIELIEIIRDWAGEKQQINGYDENYELTVEGQILESIIDKLDNVPN